MSYDFKPNNPPRNKYAVLQCTPQVAATEDVKHEPKSSAQVAVWAVPLALPQSGALKRKIKRSRNCPVSIRITQAEKSSLRRRAQAVGISVNAYLKACALIGEYVPPYPPDILQELRRVHWELTRQGHNLNQMAKHLNDGSLTPRHGFSKLDAIEAPLSRALDAVGKALTWGKTYPE